MDNINKEIEWLPMELEINDAHYFLNVEKQNDNFKITYENAEVILLSAVCRSKEEAAKAIQRRFQEAFVWTAFF